MADKRTTSFYLTDGALEALEEVAKRWGVGRNAVVEIAARLMRDNPSIFFRMVAKDSIILPEDEEGLQEYTGSSVSENPVHRKLGSEKSP